MTLQQLRLSKQTKSFEGTADSAVASDTRGQGFESSRLQFLLNNYLLLTVCRKDENKENRVWQWTILTHMVFDLEEGMGSHPVGRVILHKVIL